jgi:hypothetical protein
MKDPNDDDRINADPPEPIQVDQNA